MRHDHDDSWKSNLVQSGISRADRLSHPCHLHNNAFSVWRRCAASCDSAARPSRPHNSAPQRENECYKSINVIIVLSNTCAKCSRLSSEFVVFLKHVCKVSPQTTFPCRYRFLYILLRAQPGSQTARQAGSQAARQSGSQARAICRISRTLKLMNKSLT